MWQPKQIPPRARTPKRPRAEVRSHSIISQPLFARRFGSLRIAAITPTKRVPGRRTSFTITVPTGYRPLRARFEAYTLFVPRWASLGRAGIGVRLTFAQAV